MVIPPRSILFFLVFAFFGLLLLIPVFPKQQSARNSPPYAALIGSFVPPAEMPQKNPLPPAVGATAGIIYNPLNQSVLFQKNPEQPHGIASLTKIMTALVAYERIGTKDMIRVSKDAILTEGAEGGLIVGEHLALGDLIAIMMTESSNDAAVVIAEHVGTRNGAQTFEESRAVFVRLMNEKAFQLGLSATRFQNPTGLDIDEEAGVVSNTSSALDIARLVTYTLRYPLLWKMAEDASAVVYSKEGIRHNLSTTHALLNYEAGVVGGKTGFTDTAGGSLVTITETPLGSLSVLVVLGSSREGRFADTKNLITWLRTP